MTTIKYKHQKNMSEFVQYKALAELTELTDDGVLPPDLIECIDNALEMAHDDWLGSGNDSTSGEYQKGAFLCKAAWDHHENTVEIRTYCEFPY